MSRVVDALALSIFKNISAFLEFPFNRKKRSMGHLFMRRFFIRTVLYSSETKTTHSFFIICTNIFFVHFKHKAPLRSTTTGLTIA